MFFEKSIGQLRISFHINFPPFSFTLINISYDRIFGHVIKLCFLNTVLFINYTSKKQEEAHRQMMESISKRSEFQDW
jgi:hypothetical protein